MNKLITYFITLIVTTFIKHVLCMKGVIHSINTPEEVNHLSHPEVDVLILGAGYAGIGASIALREQQINNFLVLDAKDYIGGRVKEEKFAGATIPIGAGWIHKIELNHIIYQLAKKYKLRRYKDTYAFNLISFRHGIYGYRFNKWYVKSNEDIMRKGLKRCEAYADMEEENGDFKISLRDCLEWAGWNIRSFKNEKIREAIDYFMYDFENAGRPGDMAAWKRAYTGEGEEDQIVTDPRGYAYPILQEIKPFRNKFLLNNEVASIKRSRDSKYTVTTSDDKTYRAKHVIVTFSSGVLLAESVKFTPKLPPWKMAALGMVPMGHYCKFFFRFPYQFWEASTYIILATKIRGNYAHWQNLNLPHLFPGSNILLATLTGQMCKEKHALSDEVIIEEAMKVLRIQIPYKNAPNPIEIKRNSWSTDPHVMGAYTLPAPGVTPNDYLALEHPLHKSLWFTGEYASPEDFGYVQGAYDHGHLIAGKLAKCLTHRECPGETPEEKILVHH